MMFTWSPWGGGNGKVGHRIDWGVILIIGTIKLIIDQEVRVTKREESGRASRFLAWVFGWIVIHFSEHMTLKEEKALQGKMMSSLLRKRNFKCLRENTISPGGCGCLVLLCFAGFCCWVPILPFLSDPGFYLWGLMFKQNPLSQSSEFCLPSLRKRCVILGRPVEAIKIQSVDLEQRDLSRVPATIWF